MSPETIRALLAAGLIDQATADVLLRQDNPTAAAEWAEALLTQSTQAALLAQQERLIAAAQGDALDAAWRREDALLLDAMRPAILEIATDRAATYITASNQFNAFALINQAVIDWADTYYIDADGQTYGSIPNLNLTTRTQFARIFNEWQTGDLGGRPEGLPQLIDALSPTFGATRATAIGVTETTRIFTESLLIVERDNPFTAGFRYQTARDSRVSDICRPAEGLVIRKGETTFPDGGGFPPRHVLCRSTITPETEATLNVGSIREAIAGGSSGRI